MASTAVAIPLLSRGERPRSWSSCVSHRRRHRGHPYDAITELQPLLLWISSLTALTLIVRLGVTLLPQPVSVGPMLPQLRSVSLEIGKRPGDLNRAAPVNESDVNAQRPRHWLSEVAAESEGFLCCYSGQLLSLEVIELPNEPAAAPILQAAFHCQQLRHHALAAAGSWGQNCFAAVPFIQLPQLHTLSLSSINFSIAQPASLLRACPVVEDSVPNWMPAFTLDLLLDIGRSCRRLKKLDADNCDEDLLSHLVQPSLTEAELAAGSADAVFPQLVT
jgi:hypothetical protein